MLPAAAEGEGQGGRAGAGRRQEACGGGCRQVKQPAAGGEAAEELRCAPRAATQALHGANPICTRAGIGGALPPKTPLNRYVKWPKYVRIQRQRRVLSKRLKVR